MTISHRTNDPGRDMTERNVGGTLEAETLFRPVNTGRISEEIVEQIKLAIRAGQVRLGDRLPSERDFEGFGVSSVAVPAREKDEVWRRSRRTRGK